MREKWTGLARKPTGHSRPGVTKAGHFSGPRLSDSRRHPAGSSVGPGKTTDPQPAPTRKTMRRGSATRPPRRAPGLQEPLARSVALSPSQTARLPVAHHTRTRALLDQASTQHVRQRLRARGTSLHGDAHLARARAGAADHSPRVQPPPACPRVGGARLSPARRRARRSPLPDGPRCSGSLGLLARLGSRHRRARVGRSRRRLRPRHGNRQRCGADGPVGLHRGTLFLRLGLCPSVVRATALPSVVPCRRMLTATLRAQGVAVVALLRHFGCFCW